MIDDAMLSLNDALDELGKLRIRTNASKVDLKLTRDEARACIDSFIEIMGDMVVPDIFTTTIDFDLLKMLPDIINSPYVNIEPGMYVLYFNALYYGLTQLRGLGDPVAQGMYLKILEAVPAWLESPGDTELDGHTAALMAWTATSNHDYQLSWKFHCKSCHYVKTKKLDSIDLVPARTWDEEERKESARYLYWHVLSTDTLFRLFYGKPTVVRWVPRRVRPPHVLRTENLHPPASSVVISVVWIRYTLLTAEIINEIDDCKNIEQDESIQQKVEEYSTRMQEVIEDWKLESIMREGENNDLKYLVADHVMTMYAIIIGVRRLVRRPRSPKSVDTVSLNAARKVAEFVLDFSVDSAPPGEAQAVCIHFISFYPFCAVFSLYEHILACASPEDCEQDVQLLERIGATMSEASTKRTDFSPFARTINALNQVTRTFQDERRRAKNNGDPNTVGQTADTMPEFDMSAFAPFPEFPFNFEDGTQPLGFVRALENDFTARNWHEGWWDAGMMDVTQK
jgi:hypothetical protein